MARKKTEQRSFDEVLATLGAQRFDVAPATEGANGAATAGKARAAGAVRVSKYGCAAQIAPGPGNTVELLARPGFVLKGEIARLVDRGYQKFLKTSHMEIVATADHLRAIHEFSEELKEATGALSLYNEALGTTSDSYLYDRVAGRE